MNKTVCIYLEERDKTTDFLAPLCKHICEILSAECISYDIDSDEDPTIIIYQAVKTADTIIFLGHGDSAALYASAGDGNKLFDENNIDVLRDKRLFLMSCNSAGFIKRYNLNNAIGFGNLPTSIDDVRNWKVLHSIYIEDFSREDINLYNNALVNILWSAITPETMSDYNLLYERLKFHASIDIVRCLMQHQHVEHYRAIADLLFYMQKDIRVYSKSK